MSLWLIAGLLPLVAFVLVDVFAGPRTAVVTAIVCAVGLLGFYYSQFGELDHSMLVEASLVILMGLVALKMNDPRFFKFQPVVTGVLFAAFLAWFQYFDEPYMLKLSTRFAGAMPELKAQLENPAVKTLLARLSGQLAIVLLAHAAVVGYAALKMKNIGWLLVRLAIYPVLVVLVVVNAFLM